LKKHINIIVYGKVQGVFYRANTKLIADQLGVKGKVKNLENGTVYIEAEANIDVLNQFLKWCNEGPKHANVEKIEQQESELKNYRNFEIEK
jgi:acylphosphatase